MPTKIVLAPGYEVIAKADFDEVKAALEAREQFAVESTRGGRVIINPAHVTAIAEDPDAIQGGPFGLGTPPA